MLNLFFSLFTGDNMKFLPIVLAVGVFLFFYKTIKFVFKIIFYLAIILLLVYFFQNDILHFFGGGH
jgi:hypothetical protein